MKKTLTYVKLILSIFLFLIFIKGEKVSAEGNETKIYTAEDMQKLIEDPSGDYILMNDIDMKGIEWKSVDFTGNFDGNNHALLNLTVRSASD